jgi:hypothetical protein
MIEELVHTQSRTTSLAIEVVGELGVSFDVG